VLRRLQAFDPRTLVSKRAGPRRAREQFRPLRMPPGCCRRTRRQDREVFGDVYARGAEFWQFDLFGAENDTERSSEVGKSVHGLQPRDIR
jgi:hypothetical protein